MMQCGPDVAHDDDAFAPVGDPADDDDDDVTGLDRDAWRTPRRDHEAGESICGCGGDRDPTVAGGDR